MTPRGPRGRPGGFGGSRGRRARGAARRPGDQRTDTDRGAARDRDPDQAGGPRGQGAAVAGRQEVDGAGRAARRCAGDARARGSRYEAVTRSGFYRMTCPQRRLWCVVAWWVLFWRAPGGVDSSKWEAPKWKP